MPDVVTATILKIEYPKPPELMSSQYTLLSLDLIKAVNRIPSAEIVLVDGDAAQQEFEISDTDFFKPGSKIKILLRYEGKRDRMVFVGYVVKHSLQANLKKSTLTLYLKDPTIKLTQCRNNAIFRDQHDMAIIKDIIQTTINQDRQSNISDLKLGVLRPRATSAVHKEMVQFYCSNWDFILFRAAANGLWVLVDAGIISVQSPSLIQGHRIELEYGRDEIFDLEVEADIREQYASIDAIAWDTKTQTLSDHQRGKDYALGQNDLNPADLGKTIGADQCQLVSGAELDPKELKDWASARMSQLRLALLRGRVQVPGRADLKLGDKLVLKKFGKRFNGAALITGVRHQITEAGWQTDIQFGVSPAPFAPSHEVIEAPASHLLPAVNGLQIGVVEKTADNSGELKVQVKIPRLTATPAKSSAAKHDGLVWARLTTLDAGLTADGSRGRGTMFRPEPGDEVILGFLNDDPRQAVILGTLHSEKNKPPLPISPDNPQRGIVTKENLKIVFDDKDKSIRLETPGTNRIVLMDKEGICIVDENNNQFTMNANGIQVSSDKDIAIQAKGKVILKGANLDVK